jgi:hypothetical protein
MSTCRIEPMYTQAIEDATFRPDCAQRRLPLVVGSRSEWLWSPQRLSGVSIRLGVAFAAGNRCTNCASTWNGWGHFNGLLC